ncbi:hypothetical protein PDESU_00407 [Pontiella desulfatans]|uniref:Uncharacterized protein n=1 Tax=Pontiella desulfatans TaxID=2750659 RepID=A0A6C2TW19_PONDE|nr:hypothetical protein [Pontiella desulfatans]VGO11860.1 hypothetical protein PDESU_00407 [Pontiella desulfatans]
MNKTSSMNSLLLACCIIIPTTALCQESLDAVFSQRNTSSNHKKSELASFYTSSEQGMLKKAVLNYASKMHPEETPLEIKNGKIKTRGFLNPALKINKQQEDRALVPYQGTYQNNLAVYLYSLGEMSIHMAYHSQSSYRWSHVRSYSYGVESIPSFLEYFRESRRSVAQVFHSKSLSSHPWLGEIGGTYEAMGSYGRSGDNRISIDLKGEVIVISFLDKKSHRVRLLGFGGVDSEGKMKVIEFNSSSRYPSLFTGIIDELGQPVLRNGFDLTQLKSFMFSDGYTKIEFDGHTYINKRKLATREAEEKWHADEKADRKRQEWAAKEKVFLENLNKEAPDLIARCKKEASEKSELCIKGFYLGMDGDDAHKLFCHYSEDLIRKDHFDSDRFEDVLIDKDGKVKAFRLNHSLIMELFNAKGVSPETFIQAFVNNYGRYVPEVKKDRRFENSLTYKDAVRGYEVFITVYYEELSVVVRQTKRLSSMDFN